MNEVKHNLGRTYYADGASPTNLNGYVSKSILWDCFKANSPHKWMRSGPKKVTPAMALGRLVHTLLLEPETFSDTFALSEFDSFRSKAAQEWRDAQEAEGKIVITSDQHDLARDMQGEIALAMEEVMPLGYDAEVAVYNHSLRVKGLIDAVPRNGGFLFDLKTTSEIPADENAMERFILGRGYHWQAAMYLDLWNAATGEDRSGFTFLLAETNPACETAVVNLSEKMIDTGRGEYQHALMMWQQCLKENKWTKRYNSPITLELPTWYQV